MERHPILKLLSSSCLRREVPSVVLRSSFGRRRGQGQVALLDSWLLSQSKAPSSPSGTLLEKQVSGEQVLGENRVRKKCSKLYIKFYREGVINIFTCFLTYFINGKVFVKKQLEVAVQTGILHCTKGNSFLCSRKCHTCKFLMR